MVLYLWLGNNRILFYLQASKSRTKSKLEGGKEWEDNWIGCKRIAWVNVPQHVSEENYLIVRGAHSSLEWNI